MDESPLGSVPELAFSCAASVPLCFCVVSIKGEKTPPVVQLARVPVSKPPFTINWVEGAVTVSAIVVVATVEPEVPVIVTVEVPTVAVDDAVNVRVEVALPLAGGVTGLVENAAVTPLGSPEALSVVAELNPFWLVTVMVLVALVPCCMLTELGDAETVKPGAPAPTAKIKSSWSSYAPVLHDEA